MIVDLQEGGEELRGQNFALFAPGFPPPFPTMQSCTVAMYRSCVAVNIVYKTIIDIIISFVMWASLHSFYSLVYLCNIGKNAWDPYDKRR